MKNIKKLSLLIISIFLISLILSFSAFAHDDVKSIEENDKIFTDIPWKYELAVFSNNLSYYDDNGNYLEFCVGENKFATEGVHALKDWQIQAVFEHFYLKDGDFENSEEIFVNYEATEKTKVNGYSSYYLQGNYAYSEDNLNDEFAYYFNTYIFATKENIFIVAYEDINLSTENHNDLDVVVNGIVFNGTHFDGDKPEKNGDHDFSGSPAFDDVITGAQENLIGEVFKDGEMISIVSGVLIFLFIVPTAVLVLIAIILICKYSKNNKKLKQYEATYGNNPAYNAYPQNYGGYGYNQPVNAPYQPPVNPVYQQNPVNQNVPQSPSYVTNAVNNLEGQQTTQPSYTNIPPELQDLQNNNENKF